MLRRKVVMHPNAREISSDSVHSVVSLREAAGNAGIDACVTIGRTSGNVLSLDHQDLPLLISRKHATIMLQEDGSVTLKDLGATNGTWVNEIRLPSMGSATLQPGDMVSFGGPACIMREGVPIRNPFMYEFQPVVPAAADFDAGINDGPAAMYDSPARIPSYPVASGPEIAGQESREGLQIDSLPGRVDISVRQILNDNFSSDDSPMEAEELPRFPTNLRSRFGPTTRSLFQDPDSDPGSPATTRSRLDSSPTTSPNTRNRELETDMNPSPTKRSRTMRDCSSTGKKSRLGMLSASLGSTPSPARQVDGRTLQTLEDHFECVICRDWMVAPHSVVPCGHMYCGGCLFSLLRSNPRSPSCPQCRASIEAPPIKCLPVENILTDLLERTLTVSARKERAARRNKWEQIAPAAIDNWQNLFARRGWHREVDREHHRGGGGGNLQPNSNFSLNMMLDNLRQVRETLRSVTSSGPAPEAVSSAHHQTFVVEYARSNRSRCRRCQEVIEQRSIRLGVQTQHLHGNQLPFVATQWYHVACFPTADWDNVRSYGIHGIRALSSEHQEFINGMMAIPE